MATRKVLINRHTSTSGAPIASEMFKGEIAVAHKTGEEILWTKNNDNEMVPFISCAQTMTMINNAISDADVTYDVKAANGDAHVEVVSGGTEKAKVFTVSSKDVQSKEAFDAYSAATDATIKENYNTLSGAIDDVLEIITTAITGDEIISVDPTTSGAGSYALAHKKALATNGFKKLTTDAYGHVTAAADVVASDIKALGFEDSAWTEQKITDAIEALDSSISASTGKYFTALAIEDGKLKVKEEADVPVLSVEKSGTGNVVEAITVDGHKISYTTTSVATSHDIEELSAATINLSGVVGNFSAATNTKFSELSAYTEDVDNKVITLSSATVAEFTSAFTAIQGMDKDADAVAGQVVTTVSQTDGKVTETKANVKDLQLGGYAKDTTATGAIAATDTINTALSKLENIVAANEISNADGSINVTTGTTGTDVNVNIKTGEKVLAKDGTAGLYTDLDLVKITTGLPATVKERYQLLATDDSQIGVNIDIAKDSHIVSIRYITDSADTHYQNLEYKYLDVEGTEQTEYVDVSSLVLEAEFASGVTVTNHVAHGVVDPTSESFLTVGGAGFKLSGVQDAIDAKVNALDVTGDTAVAGQYVAAIEQTDGLVSVKTRANVSEAVLTNYAKGSDATAVAATDTVNEAISKLENQVDKAKAAATTKVVEGTDAGNNMEIASTTSSTDGSVTYTINLTDVASKAALDAEIAARKAVDGQTGQTYAANASTNYITGATSLNDADVKLDAALKTVADQVSALDYTGLTDENTKVVTNVKQEDGLVSASATQVGNLVITAITTADTKVAANDSLATIAGKLQGQIDAMDSSIATTDSGHYITAITITDGKITAAGQEALPAATPVTTVNGTTGTSVAPVLTDIVTGGTEGHELTLNYTNKVLSAQTADEAAHASAATKVDQKLTMTDGTNSQDYDGSAAKSLTFGTATSSTGVNGRSMSMTSAGVVDVEIIDCGEY